MRKSFLITLLLAVTFLTNGCDTIQNSACEAANGTILHNVCYTKGTLQTTRTVTDSSIKIENTSGATQSFEIGDETLIGTLDFTISNLGNNGIPHLASDSLKINNSRIGVGFVETYQNPIGAQMRWAIKKDILSKKVKLFIDYAGIISDSTEVRYYSSTNPNLIDKRVYSNAALQNGIDKWSSCLVGDAQTNLNNKATLAYSDIEVSELSANSKFKHSIDKVIAIEAKPKKMTESMKISVNNATCDIISFYPKKNDGTILNLGNLITAYVAFTNITSFTITGPATWQPPTI